MPLLRYLVTSCMLLAFDFGFVLGSTTGEEIKNLLGPIEHKGACFVCELSTTSSGVYKGGEPSCGPAKVSDLTVRICDGTCFTSMTKDRLERSCEKDEEADCPDKEGWKNLEKGEWKCGCPAKDLGCNNQPWSCGHMLRKAATTVIICLTIYACAY